jgi:hypothetical protein
MLSRLCPVTERVSSRLVSSRLVRTVEHLPPVIDHLAHDPSSQLARTAGNNHPLLAGWHGQRRVGKTTLRQRLGGSERGNGSRHADGILICSGWKMWSKKRARCMPWCGLYVCDPHYRARSEMGVSTCLEGGGSLHIVTARTGPDGVAPRERKGPSSCPMLGRTRRAPAPRGQQRASDGAMHGQ